MAVQAGRGVGAPALVHLGRADHLRVGTLLVPHPLVGAFGDAAGVMTSGEFFDGNIGGALLREFVLILDYSRAQLVLEPSLP